VKPAIELTQPWRKSSHSDTIHANCVEAAGFPGGVLVRDSADRHGPMLTLTRRQWRAFLEQLRA
jgi:hypothetical protein